MTKRPGPDRLSRICDWTLLLFSLGLAALAVIEIVHPSEQADLIQPTDFVRMIQSHG